LQINTLITSQHTEKRKIAQAASNQALPGKNLPLAWQEGVSSEQPATGGVCLGKAAQHSHHLFALHSANSRP
jgi:hypothetical protein